jgi:hypothetical protein
MLKPPTRFIVYLEECLLRVRTCKAFCFLKCLMFSPYDTQWVSMRFINKQLMASGLCLVWWVQSYSNSACGLGPNPRHSSSPCDFWMFSSWFVSGFTSSYITSMGEATPKMWGWAGLGWAGLGWAPHCLGPWFQECSHIGGIARQFCSFIHWVQHKFDAWGVHLYFKMTDMPSQPKRDHKRTRGVLHYGLAIYIKKYR